MPLPSEPAFSRGRARWPPERPKYRRKVPALTVRQSQVSTASRIGLPAKAVMCLVGARIVGLDRHFGRTVGDTWPERRRKSRRYSAHHRARRMGKRPVEVILRYLEERRRCVEEPQRVCQVQKQRGFQRQVDEFSSIDRRPRGDCIRFGHTRAVLRPDYIIRV
jgi:hypothetical protein